VSAKVHEQTHQDLVTLFEPTIKVCLGENNCLIHYE